MPSGEIPATTSSVALSARRRGKAEGHLGLCWPIVGGGVPQS